MGELFDTLIITLVAIPFGIFLGTGAVYVFNRMPARWLCDYGEEPSAELLDKTKKRLKDYPAKFLYSIMFIALGIYFGTKDYVFGAAALFELWLLLLITLADKKYMIIPDQFVIFLALFAFPLSVYRESVKDMIYGALLGFGAMLTVAAIGKLFARREAMGFGDVKLMSAIGLTAGLPGTVFVLLLTSLISTAYFAFGLASGRMKKNEAKPLGPFIAFSMAMYLILTTAFL